MKVSELRELLAKAEDDMDVFFDLPAVDEFLELDRVSVEYLIDDDAEVKFYFLDTAAPAEN